MEHMETHWSAASCVVAKWCWSPGPCGEGRLSYEPGRHHAIASANGNLWAYLARVFFLGAWWLSSGGAESAFAQRFACALSYAGLMGALGIYAFLAVVPDAHPQ